MIDPALDELSILRVLARLAQATDDRDEQAYRMCLADTVIANEREALSVAAETYAREAIARVWQTDWTHHKLCNAVVDLSGDRAQVNVDVVVTIAITDMFGQPCRADIGGRYDIDVVRSPGGCQIARRTFHRRYVDKHVGSHLPVPTFQHEGA